MNVNNKYSRRSRILNEIKNNNRYKKIITDLRSGKTVPRYVLRDNVSKIILEKFGNKMEEVAPTKNLTNGKKQIQWVTILGELGLNTLNVNDRKAICRKLSQLFLNKNPKKTNDENYSVPLNKNFKNIKTNNYTNNEIIESAKLSHLVWEHAWYTKRRCFKNAQNSQKKQRMSFNRTGINNTEVVNTVRIFWEPIEEDMGEKYTKDIKNYFSDMLEKIHLSFFIDKTLINNSKNCEEFIKSLKQKIASIKGNKRIPEIVHVLGMNFEKLNEKGCVPKKSEKIINWKKLLTDLGIEDNHKQIASCMVSRFIYKSGEKRRLGEKNNH